MLRTTCPNISVILYPGRFQPVHKGHVRVIEEAQKKYPNAKIIVDMDERLHDRDNPFNFEQRKNMFLERLKDSRNIIFKKHNTDNCITTNDYLNTLYQEVDMVLAGKDYPLEAVEYWERKGKKLNLAPERYYGISSTKIRERNISVITNFGCHANCWYCVWKGHELENVNEKTDWNKLEQFLFDNKEKGKVSVSGGGDCLYEYGQYVDWWTKFFKIAAQLNLLVDVHTREKFTHQSFWKKYINRCVFSSDYLPNDIDYLGFLVKLVKVRITHVVTADTTFDMIDNYLHFQEKTGCQFTIKELVGHSDNGMYKKIREKYPEIYHLDKGDYNIYYMPDNSIRESFL